MSRTLKILAASVLIAIVSTVFLASAVFADDQHLHLGWGSENGKGASYGEPYDQHGNCDHPQNAYGKNDQ